MKEMYYDIIMENRLPDVFSRIPDFPYSRKYELIALLLEKHKRDIVESALYDYSSCYINKNKVNLFKIKNELLYFCKLHNGGVG